MSLSSGANSEAAAQTENLANQGSNPPQQEQNVPLHVVMAMRDELKTLKEKNEALTNHFSMMQWQNQQAAPPQPKSQHFLDTLDPEDSMKVKDVKNLVNEFGSHMNSQLAEIKLASKTPDYADVIKKYLPKAASEDPELLDELKRSPNPYKTAYLACKASKAFQEDLFSTKSAPATQKADTDLEKMVANSKASGNLASVSNKSNTGDKYPSFSRMSDQEFMQYKNKNRYGAKQ